MAEHDNVPWRRRKQQSAHDRRQPCRRPDIGTVSRLRHQEGHVGRLQASVHLNGKLLPRRSGDNKEAAGGRSTDHRLCRSWIRDADFARGRTATEGLRIIHEYQSAVVGDGELRYHAFRRYRGEYRRDRNAQQQRWFRGLLRHHTNRVCPGQHSSQHRVHEVCAELEGRKADNPR